MWETWKQRRIEQLEYWIVQLGKALKGRGAHDFEEVVQWGTELEELRPQMDWRKDLETP